MSSFDQTDIPVLTVLNFRVIHLSLAGAVRRIVFRAHWEVKVASKLRGAGQDGTSVSAKRMTQMEVRNRQVGPGTLQRPITCLARRVFLRSAGATERFTQLLLPEPQLSLMNKQQLRPRNFSSLPEPHLIRPTRGLCNHGFFRGGQRSHASR